MGAQVKYLVAAEGSGRLSYRRDFPKPLRPYIPGKLRELKRSLGCTNIGEVGCAQRFADAGREYTQLLELARKTKGRVFDTLDKPTTAYLVVQYGVNLLTADDDIRQGTTISARPAHIRRQDHELELDALRSVKEDNNPKQAVRMFRDEAVDLATAAGLHVDPSTPEFRSFCCMLLDASIEAALVVEGRDGGTPVPTPEPPVSGQSEPATTHQVGGITLDTLINEYKSQKLEQLGEATRISYDPVFRLLRGVLGGDRLVSAIGKAEGKTVFLAITRLPVNLGKLPQLKGLTILEAIEEGAVLGLPTIQPKTINVGYAAKAKALFTWAVSEDYLATNPLKGRRVRDGVAARDKRDPFTTAQLQLVFAESPWQPRDLTGGGSAIRYWGPLIALLQGMRLGEIAQMDVGDIIERRGVPMLLVQGGKDKHVKNEDSKRALPIHPELRRMGFMDYVKQQRTSGDDKLFPGQGPNIRKQWGVSFSRWFQRLLKGLNIDGTMLGVHALRHNFEDALREADLHGTGIGRELAGRSKGKDVAGNYGKGYSTTALTRAVATISYPELDLSHLYQAETSLR